MTTEIKCRFCGKPFGSLNVIATDALRETTDAYMQHLQKVHLPKGGEAYELMAKNATIVQGVLSAVSVLVTLDAFCDVDENSEAGQRVLALVGELQDYVMEQIGVADEEEGEGEEGEPKVEIIT